MPSLRSLAKFLLPVAVIAVALGGAGLLQATRPVVEPVTLGERVFTVRTVPVNFEKHQPELHLFGELVATHEVVLQAPVEGRVIEVAPELVDGGTVRKGQVLLRLDPFDHVTEMRDLEAGLDEARARQRELELMLEAERDMLALSDQRLAIASRDLDRQKKLQSSSFASKKNLDDAQLRLTNEETARRQSEREIAALGARMDQQKAVEAKLLVSIDRVGRDIAETTVTAPFDALVGEVDVAPGKEIRAYDRLVALTEIPSIEVRFTLNDADFGRLWDDGLIGREVAANWRLGSETYPIEARIDRIQSRIEARRGGISVFAAITANPRDAPLRPGAFLDIAMKDRAYDHVVLLPRSALFDPATVYGVIDGRLVGYDVEVVDRGADDVLVRGALEEGVPLVTTRLAEMAPGLKVEMVP
ncbi:MAG: HlyD family efflux transporter periplasmic adaptor subunit [Geminicoccaceae bacterium]|nr:HlyD family efflux transporter periplasmic adaptor subunit [Geminicoccaceae bacterium]